MVLQSVNWLEAASKHLFYKLQNYLAMQNNKIKNSETPYFSTSPVQDQFGQIIVAFGITKRERLAMDIFLKITVRNTDTLQKIIEHCYKTADDFLNFEEEGQKETRSKIIL